MGIGWRCGRVRDDETGQVRCKVQISTDLKTYSQMDLIPLISDVSPKRQICDIEPILRSNLI
jgi:hypothetical protein